jgi:carbonic anhydrase
MRKTELTTYLIVVSLLGTNQLARAADPAHPDQPVVPPSEAISKLKEGNGRFTAGNAQHPHESSDERAYMAANSYENLGMNAAEAAKRRGELTKSQHPFAIIVSCSDSRVPPEIVLTKASAIYLYFE